MKQQVGTINIAPTATGYAYSLIFLLENGDAQAKKLARSEIVRLIRAAATITPDAWEKEE